MKRTRIDPLFPVMGLILVGVLLAPEAVGEDAVRSDPNVSTEASNRDPAGIEQIIEPPLQLDDEILTPVAYFYQSLGRRDPFVELVSAGSGTDPTSGDPTSDQIFVVGILWAEHDRFALVETADGRSRILREGSRMGDGTVLQILPDRVIIHVTRYGTSKNVTLPLLQGGSFHENPRARRR